MADYLLDANHISTLVMVESRLRTRILRRLQFDDTFSIAVPALTETLYGLQMMPRAAQNMDEWRQLSVVFYYYEIDRNDAEHAASLQVELRHRGWQLATIDALIAAVVLRYDLTLLTTDNDFSAIPGLARENWLATDA